jgi:Domain of unknown function (DUF4020)/SIR2-like domain
VGVGRWAYNHALVRVVSMSVRFAGVDIPWELIQAQREDRLVIFVGAGASRSSPSDLPDFRQLAARITADSGVTVTSDHLENPDVLLGDLKDQHGVDVHQRVAHLLGLGSSRPNRLHEAIAALASASPQVRIVTTNYDEHLSEALTAQAATFTQETAPALPLGDDFGGIVYLHGRLGGAVRQLVVTDADFGQAYLRDAWATRFLERMFSRYTVLFVGYSHSDVVVTYLGRGLRSDTARFVLTDDPDSLRWRRLRISPVPYPNQDGSHGALAEAILGWASWASMGLLDHRQRVAQLVAAAPSGIPEEMSYLEAVIADSRTVGFFAEHARGPEWLAWAVPQEEFQHLFNPAAEGSDCTRALAFWFAECYVMQADLSEEVWALVSNAGGLLGRDLWEAIGIHLNRRQEARPPWFSRWLVVLIQNRPRSAAPWIEYALTKSAWPEERAVALLLFDYLAEPRANLRPSFGLPSGSRVEIELRGDQYWLGQAWAEVFIPHLADVAEDLIVIADRHLRRAHTLLIAAGAAPPGWDPVRFSRSAIKPHAQDSMPEPANVLIDTARDCLESLLGSGSATGIAYLQLWADTDVPLLRRLALHGWTHRIDVDASAKLAWLTSRGWLFDHQLRHEVFALIAAIIADADPKLADALVAEAAVGPAGSAHQEYEAYNALTWIARHAPDLHSAREALALAHAQHPDYAERPHPDLMAWMETGWARPQPPMSTRELRELIENDAPGAIRELRTRTSSPGGPGWEDALSLVSDTVRGWPAGGLSVLDTTGDTPPDILAAVLRGWGATTIEDAVAREIIARLSVTNLSSKYRGIAQLLAGGGAAPTEWQRIPDARLLAARVWTMIAGGSSVLDIDGWLALAINHPAGQLAQFWVKTVAADWQAAGDSWPGLPNATREQFEAMLIGTDDKAKMAQIVCASQLHFFSAADPGWCLDHVLPLLDWADPACARRTWDGFLAWGRFDNHLLEAGLLDQYLQTAAHIDEFPEELSRQLYRHLAAVALYGDPDPGTSGWARAFTASADVPIRVAWMNQVGWDLSALPAHAVRENWRRWMRTYWADRLASIPTQLTTEEASALATWVVYLTDNIEEGIALATRTAAGITQHSRLLHELTSERISQAPSLIAKLLGHLLSNTHPPFYRCDEIKRIMQELADTAAPDVLTTIREQALRLGCTDALNGE